MVRKLLKKLNDVSTKKKLLISYMFVVFIPVLSVGLILTFGMRDMAVRSAINEASVNVERLKARVGEVLKIPIDISKNLYTSEKLEKVVSREYTSTMEVVDSYNEYTDFDEYIQINKEIGNIRFYTRNTTMLDNWRFSQITGDVKNSSWYKTATNGRGKIYWAFIYNDGLIKPGFRLNLARLALGSSLNGIGVITIEMKDGVLDSILKSEPFETLIINDRGDVVAAKDDGLVGRNINELNLGDYGMAHGKLSGQADYNGKSSRIIADTILPEDSMNGFKIISLFSIESIVAAGKQTIMLGFAIIFLCLIVSVVLIILFSGVMSKRISRLSSDMHHIATGDFNFTSQIEGKDEIGQLARDLDAMVGSINNLISEVYEADKLRNQLEVRQKEIKFRILANQVNPHFLFNVLETIRMKAHCRGEEEIAYVVKLLGKMMRKNLEVGSELVTVEDELDLVRCYLEIQKFRFGDKISYKIVCSEDIKQLRILPLIIQPLVENAIVHGLEAKGQHGAVTLEAEKEDGLLRISISDDGVGMDERKLRDVLDSLNETENFPGGRIGLKNVHQRIRLFYGDQYGLRISSSCNSGTGIDVFFPAKE